MKKYFIFFFVCMMASPVSAETIKLKSGKTVEGKIVELGDDFVKVDQGIGVDITYYLNEVESIDGRQIASKKNEQVSLSSSYPVRNGTISVETLVDNASKSERSFENLSCKFVFSMFDEKDGAVNFVNEYEWQLWIKKPFLMRINASDFEMLCKKEGEDFYTYFWNPQKNTFTKIRMSAKSWPAYPSPEAEVVRLKLDFEKSKSHSVEENNKEYILMLELAELGVKKVYYIDKETGLIIKTLSYKNNVMFSAHEWKDIKVNAGLSDDSFELKIPAGATEITKDLTK